MAWADDTWVLDASQHGLHQMLRQLSPHAWQTTGLDIRWEKCAYAQATGKRRQPPTVETSPTPTETEQYGPGMCLNVLGSHVQTGPHRSDKCSTATSDGRRGTQCKSSLLLLSVFPNFWLVFGDMVLDAAGARTGESATAPDVQKRIGALADAVRGCSDALQVDSHYGATASTRLPKCHDGRRICFVFGVATGRTHRKTCSSRRHTQRAACSGDPRVRHEAA